MHPVGNHRSRPAKNAGKHLTCTKHGINPKAYPCDMAGHFDGTFIRNLVLNRNKSHIFSTLNRKFTINHLI